MVPLFFGDSRRPLFGIYDSAQGERRSEQAVLICPSIGHEQIRGYSAVRQLANGLSQRGCHVLRFDYCGVGDSAGDIPDLSVAQWQRDVRAALEELEGLSGATRLSVVGLRIGAALAATALLPGGEDPVSPLESLVLWDPVIDGGAYLDGLDKLWREMLADPERFTSSQTPSDAELMGFLTPPALRREIGALDLLRLARWPAAKNVVVVDSTGAAAVAALRTRLGELGQSVVYTPVPERAMWDVYAHVEVPIRAGHASAVLQALP